MTYFAGTYDVAVIGAGHAGIEAALAAARLGCHTAVFTINMDAVGNCPCNPSIGGTAKGHLVRELDALGGEMGKTADACFLQSRMLNRGKGPAVHSLRAQIDRRRYSETMKHKLELQENLELRQAEITSIEKAEGGYLLTTQMLAQYLCKTVVVATGTYLGGRIYVGEVSYESGPDGMFPATKLALSLKKLGLPLRRFKTGTPARILRRSIDFSDLEVQKGDVPPQPFSYETESLGDNKVDCHISWTNDGGLENPAAQNIRGPAGRDGAQGPAGASAFEAAVDAGYQGTEATFNAALAALPYHGARHLPGGADPISVGTGSLEDGAVTAEALFKHGVLQELLHLAGLGFFPGRDDEDLRRKARLTEHIRDL